MAPASSVRHVQCAAANTETVLAETKASAQSPLALKAQARSSVKGVTVDTIRGKKQSPKDAVPVPGTPKMATPVKRPVSADLPRKVHARNIHHTNTTACLCKAPSGHT